MKYSIFIALVLIGCQQRDHDFDINYVNVQKALISDSAFKKFFGLAIFTREPHLYMVDVYEPNVTFFVSYSEGLNKVDRLKLIGSLSRSNSVNSKNPEERADSIIARIQDALSFMEKYSLWSVTFNYENVPGKLAFIIKSKEDYFMDFCFSRSRYLRYYHIPDNEIKSYPNDVIEAKWIDSSWVYLKCGCDTVITK